MPLYEYVCEKCGQRIEVMQKMTDEPLKKCRNCRGKIEKVISRTSFRLKGSGWYMTDYSRKSSPGHTDSSKSSENKGAKAKPPGCKNGSCSGCE